MVVADEINAPVMVFFDMSPKSTVSTWGKTANPLGHPTNTWISVIIPDLWQAPVGAVPTSLLSTKNAIPPGRSTQDHPTHCHRPRHFLRYLLLHKVCVWRNDERSNRWRRATKCQQGASKGTVALVAPIRHSQTHLQLAENAGWLLENHPQLRIGEMSWTKLSNTQTMF